MIHVSFLVFLLPRIQSFHIHLFHRPYFTSIRHKCFHNLSLCFNYNCFTNSSILKNRGDDKSLARPGRKQARKHVRDARDFNNIETRAIIKFFFPLQGKAPKEIQDILTETLACFLPGRGHGLISTPVSVPNYMNIYRVSIRSFPDYKKMFTWTCWNFTLHLRRVSAVDNFSTTWCTSTLGVHTFIGFWMHHFKTGGLGEWSDTLATTIAGYHPP